MSYIASWEILMEKEFIAKGRVKGFAKGFAEGFVKGRAEGRSEVQNEIAAALLDERMAAGKIAVITKLPLQTILDLQDQPEE